MMAGAEVLLEAEADVGEAPHWLGDGLLLWVDITRNEIHRLDAGSGIDTVLATLPEMVGAAVPARSGGLVAATETGFVRVGMDGSFTSIARVESEIASNRMNDGKCDPSGRFWAGTMAYDQAAGAGALYCLRTEGSVTTELSAVTLSNGLGWSPDQRTMYYIDSAHPWVNVFDFDAETGTCGPQRDRIAVPVSGSASIPDGLTVDQQGGLWVAIWGDGRIQRFLPDGTRDVHVELPVSQVTSCAFGGSDLSTLFVTSARYQLDEDSLRREPHAGAVFAVRTPFCGQAPAIYEDPDPDPTTAV